MKLNINGELKEVCCYCGTMTAPHHETCPNNPHFSDYMKARQAENDERIQRKEQARQLAKARTATHFVTMTDWTNLWEVGIGWVKQGKFIYKVVIPCNSRKEAVHAVRNAKKWKIYNNIRISKTQPYYNPRTHRTSLKSSSDLWIMSED